MNIRTAQWLRSPWVGTASTLLVVIAGGLGSIFSTEVRASFPLWGSGAWTWQAASFWLVALAASLLYFFREQANDAVQQRLQDEARARIDALTHLIRTQPPEDFLLDFSAFYDDADRIVSAALQPEIVLAERQQSARNLLGMIATLAQRFDGDDQEVIYAANIMRAFNPAELSAQALAQVETCLQFSDEDLALARQRAVLILDPQLSTRVDDEEARPDPDMAPIALAVPVQSFLHGKYRVLPGAPLAFAEGRPSQFADCAALSGWCAQNGDFTQATISALSNYFAASPVKGFFSVPLFARLSDNEMFPFAVLNVHCTRAGLLGQGESLEHFYNIIYPLQILLGRLLLSMPNRLPTLT